MGSVRKIVSTKTGKVSWQIDYLEPDGKRIRKNFKKQKDAKAHLAKYENNINTGDYVDPQKYRKATLKELIEKYEENYSYQPAYATFKKCQIQFIKGYFGENRYLFNIRYVDLETFRNKLKNTPTWHKKERTDASVNRCMACLRHMLRKAVEWDMIKQNPFEMGASLQFKENNMRFRFLQEDEIDRLLAECPEHLKDIVECAINTGMRYGEIIDLKWDQVRNGHIYLQKTKSNKARQIPTNEDLNVLLMRIRKKQHLISEYVFNKNRKHIRSVRVGFIAALKRAGIVDFRFHDLRHTFASHFVMRGGSLKALQEILGHASIKTTMRYAHLSQEHKREAINLLNGLTSKNSMSHFVTNSPISSNGTV